MVGYYPILTMQGTCPCGSMGESGGCYSSQNKANAERWLLFSYLVNTVNSVDFKEVELTNSRTVAPRSCSRENGELGWKSSTRRWIHLGDQMLSVVTTVNVLATLFTTVTRYLTVFKGKINSGSQFWEDTVHLDREDMAGENMTWLATLCLQSETTERWMLVVSSHSSTHSSLSSLESPTLRMGLPCSVLNFLGNAFTDTPGGVSPREFQIQSGWQSSQLVTIL